LVNAVNDLGCDQCEGLGLTIDLVVPVRYVERGDIGKAITRVFGW
jgi:hypothetical protein